MMSSYLVKISQFGQRQSEATRHDVPVQDGPLSELVL